MKPTTVANEPPGRVWSPAIFALIKARRPAKESTINMAELTSASRNRLATSSFALPGRRYPIHDKAHARNALARVSQHGSSSEKARVRAAVHRRFPGIGKGGSVPLSSLKRAS